MTLGDKPSFLRAMYVCAEALNEPLTETRVEAYFLALADLDITRVVDAWADAVKYSRFFPKPVEIREYIEATIKEERRVKRIRELGAPFDTPEPSPEERAACAKIIADVTRKLTKPYEGN